MPPPLIPSLRLGAAALLARPLTGPRGTAMLAPAAYRLPLSQLPVSSQVRHLSSLRPGKESQQTLPGQNDRAVKRQSVLDRMGATRSVKIVIIVCLCVYGTVESVFYYNWLRRYFSQKPDSAADQNQ